MYCLLPLTNYSLVVGDYLQRFQKTMKASSILGYWNYLLQSITWFHLYSDLNTKARFGDLKADYIKKGCKSYKRAQNTVCTKNRMDDNCIGDLSVCVIFFLFDPFLWLNSPPLFSRCFSEKFFELYTLK